MGRLRGDVGPLRHDDAMPAALTAADPAAAAAALPPYFWLQPAVTAAAAAVVLLGAAITVRQRYRADRKDQWWKRTQWALELMLDSDEDRQVLGLQVLDQQTGARVADGEDQRFVVEVVLPLTEYYLRNLDSDSAEQDTGVSAADRPSGRASGTAPSTEENR